MTRRIASSIVELNNGALAHFMDGEYDKAISLLRVAYEIFEMHRRKANTTSSSTSSADDLEQNPQSQDQSLSFLKEFETTLLSRTTRPKRTRGDVPTMMMDYDEVNDNLIVEKSSSVQSSMRKRRKLNVSEKDSSSSATTTSIASTSGLDTAAATSSCSVPSTACYSMYNRALVLSSEQEDDESMFVLHPSRTSAVILYNLALVHHNVGIRLGISSALPHALRLYEMSLMEVMGDKDLLNAQGLPLLQATNCFWLDLLQKQKLLLALWNNMGNIYAYLFHFENTQRCLDNLKLVLALHQTHTSILRTSNTTIVPGMDEDYIFFFLNALFQGKELCFAPAA